MAMDIGGAARLGGVMLVAGWLAGCAATATTPPSPSIPMAQGVAANGEVFARAQCADCHAIGADGQSYLADAPVFGEVARRYPSTSLDLTLARISQVGHYAMPPRNLTLAQRADLAAYLRTLAAAPRNGDAPRS